MHGPRQRLACNPHNELSLALVELWAAQQRQEDGVQQGAWLRLACGATYSGWGASTAEQQLVRGLHMS